MKGGMFSHAATNMIVTGRGTVKRMKAAILSGNIFHWEWHVYWKFQDSVLQQQHCENLKISH